jgi:hypothetical protein
VTTIMLACVHELNLNLLKLLPRSCPNVFDLAGAAVTKLTHLQLGRTLLDEIVSRR